MKAARNKRAVLFNLSYIPELAKLPHSEDNKKKKVVTSSGREEPVKATRGISGVIEMFYSYLGLWFK